MSTDFGAPSKTIDKERRKKEKALRRKEEKKAGKKSPEKRRRVEDPDVAGVGVDQSLEVQEHAQVVSTPKKRLRTVKSPRKEKSSPEPDTKQPPPATATATATTDLGRIDSPFHGVTASLRLPLPSAALSSPFEGICSTYLSPLLLTWNPQLKGVIMAYNNLRISSTPTIDHTKDEIKQGETAILARVVDECAYPYIWATAHFLICRPEKNTYLPAQTNIQSESHQSLTLWNMFNVSIDRMHIPSKWTFDENATTGPEPKYDAEGEISGQEEIYGYWRDEFGSIVKGMLRFRVLDFDVAAPGAPGSRTDNGLITLEGSLLSEEDEKKLEKEGYQRTDTTTVSKRRADATAAASVHSAASSSR